MQYALGAMLVARSWKKTDTREYVTAISAINASSSKDKVLAKLKFFDIGRVDRRNADATRHPFRVR
jgi:hypothetical protein